MWERPRGLAFHSRGGTVVVVWDERPGGSTLSRRPGADLIDIAGASVPDEVVPVAGTPYYIVIPGKLTLLGVRDRLSGWID